MDFFTSFKISASGLSAQRKRMNMVASNIANMETTRTSEGGPYKRKDVVFEAEPVSQKIKTEPGNDGSLVRVSKVIEDNSPSKMVYDPRHPDADKHGYVAMPNINLMEEMVDMISATRAYEANATVISASKSMAQKALGIFGR